MKFPTSDKFFDILKQYQKEVNELRAERIAKNANLLALVATAQPHQDPYYQTSKSHKSYAPTSKSALPTRYHVTTRHKGREIAKPITPPYESPSDEDSDLEQAQKEKEMYKNDNQTGQFRNQKAVNVAGARDTVGGQVMQQSKIQCFNCKEFEQSDWLADMDEEIDEQELEAHYSYMAKIQEVPNADSDTDSEPLEQTELEKYMAFNDRIVDYDKLERNLNETLGLLAQMDIDIKEGLVKEKTKVITDLKLKEEKDIDKMISIENQFKFLNEIIYKKSQSIQTIHMLAPKCPAFNGTPTFVNPMYLKKAQNEKPCLYEIPHDQSDPANKLVPDREEILTLKEKSQSKLNKDLNDSFAFVHELKKEMPADLKYVESLENEIDELEFDKAEFSNMYDMLLQECVSNDVMCSYLHSLSDLDAHTELQCLYLHKVKEYEYLKAQLQDKKIAISELKKLVEKCKGKSVETKFDQPSVVRQPKAQRISKPSVLGKPAPFLDSLERKNFSTKKSVPKTNESEGVLYITNVSRPQLRSTQMKDKVMPNNSHVKDKKTEVEDHHRISRKCVFNSNHDACVFRYLNDVNARTKKPNVVPISTRKPKSQSNKSVATPHKKTVASESTTHKSKSYYRMLYEKTSKAWKWRIEQQCPSGYKWVPKKKMKWVPKVRNENVQKRVSFAIDNASSITNVLNLTNTLGSNLFQSSRKYHDHQGLLRNEGLNHNLFSVGQFCDADLEVAFQKSTCFVRDLQGKDLLTSNCGSDLYYNFPQDNLRHQLHLSSCLKPYQLKLKHGLYAIEDFLHLKTSTRFLLAFKQKDGRELVVPKLNSSNKTLNAFLKNKKELSIKPSTPQNTPDEAWRFETMKLYNWSEAASTPCLSQLLNFLSCLLAALTIIIPHRYLQH
ncbi:hypothetical protein Tco_1020375 [Tanacetum coccineum]|uniref:Integrase, catalytic region, zinc finger, CCHC-type, peptidase aspartic, catalytic n=1 Tax=Tanacetum coccineum TaxID=301880 RepID=A0ABQ5G187_9ASTR